MRKFFSLISLGLLLFAGTAVYAADVRVVATLDREEVAVGDAAYLTVKILDGRGNIQAPAIPPLQDLEIHYTGRASRMSLINGISSSSLEFSYVVSPRHVGTFAIPSLTVSVNGTPFKTNPVQIRAVDGGGSSSAAGGMPGSPAPVMPSQPVVVSKAQPPAGADNRIFAEAQLSKFTVYQNEQTLLNYALYTSYDTRYEGFDTEPELSGFWIEEFPQEKEVARQMVSIGGRRYIKADIKKVALFPTAPGKYTIQPGKIKTTIKQDQQQDNVFDEFFNDSFFNGGNFFSKRENRILTPKPLQIEVKPLPEAGKPADFQGDVGQYQMNAVLDRTEVKQNEPVKMTLTIEGTGNIDRVNRPHIPDLKGFRTYEADSKSEVSRVNDLISGRKTFEIVFIPRDEGKMFIPPLKLSFFDPAQGQYKTVATPNFALNVLKGEEGPALPDEVVKQPELKKQVEIENKDIHFVEIHWPRVTLWTRVVQGMVPVLGALNLLFLGLIGWAIFQEKQRSFISANRGLYRNKRARAAAMNEMNRLKKLAHNKDITAQTEFFQHLERSMNQYFADKWDLSTHGMTRSEIDRRLREAFQEADEKIVEEVADVFQLCDESRFARGAMPDSSKQLALRVFKDVVNRLEKIK